MKLTKKSEYALLALLVLARNPTGSYLTVDSIAKVHGIPVNFLEQLLLILKRAKFVKSMKGQGGGYQLAKAPESVSLAEVIRLFDGALAPTESVSEYFYEPTPIEKEKALVKVFREIRDFVAEKLERTTLADLV